MVQRNSAVVLALTFVALPLGGGPADARGAGEVVDLAQRYPTTLDRGDVDVGRARPWTFGPEDIYELSSFAFQVGEDLKIDVASAHLGVGHCADGAVWAVVVPVDGGAKDAARLRGSGRDEEEVAHVWLRFHPREIDRLFPPATVRAAAGAPAATRPAHPESREAGADDLLAKMQRIARAKFRSSFHAGERAMIPERNQMTVDVDVRSGWRRLFVVDTTAGTAEYRPEAAKMAVKPPPPVSQPSDAARSFDQLWEAFDQHYAMFGLRPEVDWNAMREKYRPKAMAARNAEEFAEVCAEMLRPLRDLHIWVSVGSVPVEVFNRPREANANPGAYEALLGELHPGGDNLRWAKTEDAIGFVVIPAWNNGKIPEDFDQVLEEMRDTRGLIVDVRLNGGGSEPLAQQVAGRFAEASHVYSYHQVRSGPRHADLTEKQARSFGPRGPWRYDRPVILLMGQKCMSSNESFVAMMGECPQVTTMGDRTCGSSGNPTMLDLPVGVTVSVPQWIDLLPDGTPLDERGVQPDVRFEPQPGAFEGTRDDLLAAAIERLRKEPLPEKPIAGPAAASGSPAGGGVTRKDEAAAKLAEDPNRPHVVEVWPADGASEVDPNTELRIRFDRPMDVRRMWLTWKAGAYRGCGEIRYDTDKNEFVIPVRLEPRASEAIAVNFVGGAEQPQGFESREGVPAAPFIWKFRTGGSGRTPDAPTPKPTLVDPPSGSEVSPVTLLKIEFDEPMDPGAYRLVARGAGNEVGAESPELMPEAEYDAQNRRFTFVVVLPAGSSSRFELQGLVSERGVEARPIELEYRTGKEPLSPAHRERLAEEARSPELLSVLGDVRRMRQDLQSFSESVTEVACAGRDARFDQLRSYWATFRMQNPRQFFGDVSSYMGPACQFRVGSDGERCWWYYDGPPERKLVVCPFDEVTEKNLSLCSPFGGLEDDPPRTAAERNLSYRGTAQVGGRRCHLIRGWSAWVRQGGSRSFTRCSITDWYIDAETSRPLRVVQASPGYRAVRDFAWTQVNETLAATEFGPPAVEGLSPSGLDSLGEGFDRHFLTIMDGSDGTISLRWGKRGPKSKSSSGLN